MHWLKTALETLIFTVASPSSGCHWKTNCNTISHFCQLFPSSFTLMCNYRPWCFAAQPSSSPVMPPFAATTFQGSTLGLLEGELLNYVWSCQNLPSLTLRQQSALFWWSSLSWKASGFHQGCCRLYDAEKHWMKNQKQNFSLKACTEQGFARTVATSLPKLSLVDGMKFSTSEQSERLEQFWGHT